MRDLSRQKSKTLNHHMLKFDFMVTTWAKSSLFIFQLFYMFKIDVKVQKLPMGMKLDQGDYYSWGNISEAKKLSLILF